ncbi:MAG: cation:proton antiporter [Candidatus Rokubacteria bacterium]|nr:cation:proton antiporter [Betaproteobacteria bacterium]MBM4441081.1 cation:proton antiporter [Candidatus Rokubacteria bacterium]
MATFLPQYPFAANPLLLFGLLLLAGYAGGELVQRLLGVPRIVGYALVGLALGASGLGVLDARLVGEAWIFVDIALGLILFELGCRLDLAWLRRDRWLAATGVLESALAFVFVYGALVIFGVEPLVAAMAAAIGMATSPAVVIVVAQELRAEGQVTERALNLVAMNSVIAFVTATMLLSWIHHEYQAGVVMALLHPLYLLAGSLLLGYGAAIAALALGRWLGKSERGQYVLALALVVVVVGSARMLEVSAVLGVLAFGVLSRNLDARHDLMPFDVGRLGQLFVVVLFVVTSATLKVGELVSGAALALAFVLARFAGKSLGVLALTYLSGVRRGAAGLLCLALTPMSVLAVAMVRGAGEMYPEFGARLAAIVLSAVIILDLVGPVAVQFALKRAGEAAPEETAR